MKNPLLKDISRHISRSGGWRYRAPATRVFDRRKYHASLRIHFQSFRLFRAKEKS